MPVECVCYYASDFGEYQHSQASENHLNQNVPSPGVYNDNFIDLCQSPGKAPDNVIPYPRPAPSVELRSGILYSGCQCLKRDGLQQDCPRTGCQGRGPCMAFPVPVCQPSGNAPPLEKPPSAPRPPVVARRNHAHMDCLGAPKAHARTPPQAQGHGRYVKLGQQNYKDNPPVRPQRPPCKEHKRPRT